MKKRAQRTLAVAAPIEQSFPTFPSLSVFYSETHTGLGPAELPPEVANGLRAAVGLRTAWVWLGGAFLSNASLPGAQGMQASRSHHRP